MAPKSGIGGSQLPLLAFVRMEWRIGWRTAAFRLAATAAFIFGISVGGEVGRGVGLSAYSTADAACIYLAFGAIVWMSLAAVRESTLRTNILVFSKPQPSELLALSKFVGAYLQLLAILLAMFAGSIVSRVFNGGLLGFDAYLLQYGRAAAVLFFAACASYLPALLFDSALAGATVGLYWLFTLTGKPYLGKFYFPTYSQNLAAYIALGATLLFATLYFYRRAQRGGARPALWVRAGIPILLLVTGWQFWRVIVEGHDPEARLSPAMERMADQDTALGRRAAGFYLPDQAGKLTGLSDYDGKILVIALWSPRDPDSVLLLDRLNEIQSEFAGSGVQAIAVTICEDTGATTTFAIGEDLHYPVVTDWGSYNAPRGSELSPIATAYRASSLPQVAVTDRRRTVRTILSGIEAYDGDGLRRVVKERLDDEPR
jgi:peroxiredoxin